MAEDLASQLNDNLDGWGRAMGLRYVRAVPDEVVIEWTIGPQHLQPFGLVHGGVYCGVIEAACSVGAGLTQAARGLQPSAVGLENHTSFIRAQREGTLRAIAKPLTRGRTTQLWEAHIYDAHDHLVASGRVRLHTVPAPDPAQARSEGPS